MKDYLLLDAARMDGYIFMAQDLNEDHRCLYEGDSEKFLGSSGPWLFDLVRNSHFAEWVADTGAGESWGVVIEADAEEEVLYRHLRKFLIVLTEEGKELYFRFYDPRVLRVFLPTCDTEQLLEFFGPVSSFIMENEEGSMIRFSLKGHVLYLEKSESSLKDFFSKDGISWSFSLDEGSTEIDDQKEEIDSSKWDFGF